MIEYGSDKRVLLIGASVRALAFAAIRAGWYPRCADLFADRDLQTWAPVTRIERSQYPEGLIQWLRKSERAAPVLYTGRLERYIRVLAEIQKAWPLWANPATVARAVRDPAQLARAAIQAGLPFPEWSRSPEGLPRDGTWLAKTEGGVVRWYGQRLPSQVRYYQRCIPGMPASAVFLADGRSCFWLGATRQLLGCRWLQAREFQWCGNLGPLRCAAPLAERLRRLGETLTSYFGLRGVFGVDFVLQDETPWLVEINPRYPASLEVLELASAWPWFSAHAAVFMADEQSSPLRQFSCQRAPLMTGGDSCCVGKAILYATFALRFRLRYIAEIGPILTPAGLLSDIAIADVPHEDAFIPGRYPILTILARGKDWTDTLNRLKQAASQVYTALKHRSD
jgi:predicted ATP-grasp superfamily ATP-dependent carboligase